MDHEKCGTKTPKNNRHEGVPTGNSVQLLFPFVRNVLNAEDKFDVLPAFKIIKSEHKRTQEN